MRQVIIGGSIAGISAAKAIRLSDPSAEITIFSAEKTRPYYRPMIPSLIKRQEVDITFDDDIEKKYGIEFMYAEATGLDTAKQEVQFASGRHVAYDRLLIATGSRPLIPDIPGIRGKGVFTIRTAADALGIKARAGEAENAVILGGGLVGIKTAIALKKFGLEATVIERLGQILYRRFDKRGAEIISGILRREGVAARTGISISEVVRAGGTVRSVRLSSGETLAADMLVVAVGTEPNVGVVKGSDVRINRGIVINEYLQTSVSGIYAAGDVVEYTDLVTGKSSVSALWMNAEEMGRLAGRNMAGAKAKYSGFLSVLNSAEIFDVPVMAIGRIDADPADKDYETLVEDNIESYKKLVFKGSILAGAVFINDVENAGIYTNLIRNGIPIGPLKEEAIKGSLRYIDFLRTVPEEALTA
jgi:nitrite reductase (NADH) large subunit